MIFKIYSGLERPKMSQSHPKLNDILIDAMNVQVRVNLIHESSSYHLNNLTDKMERCKRKKERERE